MHTVKNEQRSSSRSRAGNIYLADCPSRGVLDHATSRWGSLALLMLLERKHRFSELLHRIGGVSQKMLAQSLKTLEQDGFVLRVVISTKAPRVEYSLTESGREIASRVAELARWVEENVGTVLENREQFARKSQVRLAGSKYTEQASDRSIAPTRAT